MDKSSELTRKIFESLNAQANYAVLRNFEGLPYKNFGRDIDILIFKKNFQLIRNQLLDIINKSGFKIISYYKVERESFICGINDNGQYHLIQFDFLFSCEVKGLLLIDVDPILNNRIFNGNVYHVTPEYEFLVKYLYNHLLGYPYPEKYSHLKDRMMSNSFIHSEINRLFGLSLSDFEEYDGNNLYRTKLLSNLLKAPLKQGTHLIRFIYLKILSQFYSSGITLGFTGSDGSGKTTVIELLHKNISPVFGEATEFFHFNPALLPNLGEAFHSVGIKKEVDREYNSPHRGGKKEILNSFLRLCYYTVDYILGFWVKVKPHCRITKFVIFDRYYTDIIVDSHRSSIYLNTKFLYYWGKLFVPRLQYNFLLTADTDVILSRKQELSREGIETINQKLRFLSRGKGYYLIENNGTPDEAVQKILKIIFEEQHQKDLKRLGYACK